MDFLLVCYVCYHYDLPMPAIAAAMGLFFFYLFTDVIFAAVAAVLVLAAKKTIDGQRMPSDIRTGLTAYFCLMLDR